MSEVDHEGTTSIVQFAACWHMIQWASLTLTLQLACYMTVLQVVQGQSECESFADLYNESALGIGADADGIPLPQAPAADVLCDML